MPDGALSELALAAAVTAWWSRWQPTTIHTALRAGATVTDVAAATGLDETEVIRRWTRWTEVQTILIIAGRPCVDPDEVRTIRQRIGEIGEEVNP
jgi:transposase-like protein